MKSGCENHDNKLNLMVNMIRSHQFENKIQPALNAIYKLFQSYTLSYLYLKGHTNMNFELENILGITQGCNLYLATNLLNDTGQLA